MERKLLLGIDFNNVLFSSYYGSPLLNSKGMNINAIKGFFFKLKLLKETFNPDYIVLSNDISRSRTFRRKLYKPYKAQRKVHNDDIINQMKYTMNISALLGYPIINHELYEADDILGMISQYTHENDIDMIIVSSDKDLYQLINDTTYIYSPRNKELIDMKWLYDKYHLTPDQWIELKMLQGDRSDNIPGIPGIGEVTALKLMQQFNSIESIYKHLGYIRPNIRELLKKGESILPLTRELVTIIKDYTKIDFKPQMIEPNERYEQEIYSIIEELEIYSLFNVMNYSLFIDKPKQ